MRDHDFKNAVGEGEDALGKLIDAVSLAQAHAQETDATGHAEFYENVLGHLNTAKEALIDAYTLLLNGDEALGVDALDDEVEEVGNNDRFEVTIIATIHALTSAGAKKQAEAFIAKGSPSFPAYAESARKTTPI
jgi:hypothetical protein